MGIELTIRDGERVITLSGESGVQRLLAYAPRVGSWGEDGVPAPVTESCELFFDTISEGRARLASLTRLFERVEQARRAGRPSGIWLTLRLSPTELLYRSELLAGRVEWSEDVLRPWRLPAGTGRAVVMWTRQGYWEGPEQELPLSNGNGTEVTGGLLLWNHDDSDGSLEAGLWMGMGGLTYMEASATDSQSHDNWLHVQASALTGELPAPVRLELTNQSATGARAGTFYIAHHRHPDGAFSSQTLEAEAGSGGVTTFAASESGGACQSLSWSGTAESQLLAWTLSPSMLQWCAGGYFQLLARFVTAPVYSNLWLRFRVRLGAALVWEGPSTLANGHVLQPLGALPLPPYPIGGVPFPLVLELTARRDSAGPHSLDLDAVQLAPLDGWRALTSSGNGLAATRRLVDDMIAGELYADDGAGSGRTADFLATGRPILLHPGEPHRLYFLHDALDGTADIDRQLRVRAWYRPRVTTPVAGGG